MHPITQMGRSAGKTTMTWQHLQAISRRKQPDMADEYQDLLAGDSLKQVCRSIQDPKNPINPAVRKLMDTCTFQALVDHPELRAQLLLLILVDQDVQELHDQLLKTKNGTNAELHARVWERATTMLKQTYEDYELLRRLTDPETQYLRYTPKNLAVT